MENVDLSKAMTLARDNTVVIINEYTTLTQDSNRSEKYTGKCPYCGNDGKTFMINSFTGVLYCFSCHKGGNPLQFVADMERVGLHEAAIVVLGRFGGDKG